MFWETKSIMRKQWKKSMCSELGFFLEPWCRRQQPTPSLLSTYSVFRTHWLFQFLSTKWDHVSKIREYKFWSVFAQFLPPSDMFIPLLYSEYKLPGSILGVVIGLCFFWILSSGKVSCISLYSTHGNVMYTVHFHIPESLKWVKLTWRTETALLSVLVLRLGCVCTLLYITLHYAKYNKVFSDCAQFSDSTIVSIFHSSSWLKRVTLDLGRWHCLAPSIWHILVYGLFPGT